MAQSLASERRIDLAHAVDFALGPASVRPAMREIRIGSSSRTIEPRVMQMLVALARAGGAPVSRDDLIAMCWDGLAITDDAITQCVSKLRRAVAGLEGVAIETVPRVGYRLAGDVASIAGSRKVALPAGEHRFSLRWMSILAAAVTISAIAVPSFRPMSLEQPMDRSGLRAVVPPTPQSRKADRLHATAVSLFRERTRPGYVEAEKLLRQAVALDPSHAPSWARLGMVVYAPSWWAAQDDPDARPRLRSEALGYVRRALAIEPDLAEAHQAMAFVLWDQDPLPWLRRAVALDPADAEIWYQLAQVLEAGLEFRGALSAAQRALEIEPTTPRVLATNIFLLHRLGRRDEAYRLVDRLEHVANRSPEARLARSALAYGEGRLADAVAECAEALASNSGDRWGPQITMLRVTHLLGDRATGRRLLQVEPKLAAVISSYDDPAHALRLAREAPDQWWDELFPGAKARLLLNLDAGALLLSLYDRRYGSVADFWQNNRATNLSLAAPLILAMRDAGRRGEAKELRSRFATDLARMAREGDTSPGLSVGVAQLAALDDRPEVAARWLEAAIAAGWKGQSPELGLHPDHDPVFESVRGDPRFQRAIGRYRASLEVEATALRRLDLNRLDWAVRNSGTPKV